MNTKKDLLATGVPAAKDAEGVCRDWAYEIRDKLGHGVLRTDRGFESESDAELQAAMEAKADNIKGFYVRTFQPAYGG